MNKIILVFFISCILFAVIAAGVIVIESLDIDILGSMDNSSDNKKDDEEALMEAFEYAENNIVTLDGVLGVSWTKDPPRIIIYVDEEHADDMPEKVKGFKTEIRISDDFTA
jgi:hypothetical protein